jgi:hypothetical protein
VGHWSSFKLEASSFVVDRGFERLVSRWGSSIS